MGYVVHLTETCDEDRPRLVAHADTTPGDVHEAARADPILAALNERGLRGVKMVTSDDHESIKSAVKVELPGAVWQRCTVHFQRNVLAHVPQAESEAGASDLQVIFQAARRETAESRAASFAERYGSLYAKAVATLTGGLDEALTYTAFPSSHHRLIRTTNGLERTFREVKRRTRVVGVFPNEQSAETLATAGRLRVSEDWASHRYLDMAPLDALFH